MAIIGYDLSTVILRDYAICYVKSSFQHALSPTYIKSLIIVSARKVLLKILLGHLISVLSI